MRDHMDRQIPKSPSRRRPVLGQLVLKCLLPAVLLAGCTTLPDEATAPTMLLVSLSNGSIIGQEIAVDADICMKSISEPETLCFQQGAAIVQGDDIVGYEMIRTELNLYDE